jgi:hypothetical protein
MLKAFVKELGGQYQELLKGASYPSGESRLLIYACCCYSKFNNNGNSPDEVDAGIDTSEHSDEEGLESDDDMEDSVIAIELYAQGWTIIQRRNDGEDRNMHV